MEENTMIPIKPYIRSGSPLGVLYLVYTITALPLAGATMQEPSRASEMEQKRHRENINQTLGCLIGTKNTYENIRHDQIDHNLRNHIASFAAPQTSYEFPIDFLVNATIIPKEWGRVCDIKRGPDGNLKILTCKDTLTFNSLFPYFRFLCFSSAIAVMATAVYDGQGYPLSGVTLGILGICYAGHRKDTPAVEIAIYDLTTQRKETSITIKKSALGVDKTAYFLGTIRAIEIGPIKIETIIDMLPITFYIQPSGKWLKVEPPQDPTSSAIRYSHLAQLIWLNAEGLADPSEWGNYWNPQATIYTSLSLGVSRNLVTDLDFDPNSLPTLDEHRSKSYSIRHGISRHVLHSPNLHGYGRRTIAHLNSMRLTSINQGMRFLIGQFNTVTLNKFVITNNNSGQTVTRTIHLPHIITEENIYAPLKSTDSNGVVLKISKQSFNTGNANEPNHVTVILDLKEQSLSPQLKIMIENIIRSRSSEGYDKHEPHKFSLQTLGSSLGQRILENLRYFYDVDKERLKAEEKTAFWRKTTTYAAVGALGLSILCNKLCRS
jgi:hypothetical protein